MGKICGRFFWLAAGKRRVDFETELNYQAEVQRGSWETTKLRHDQFPIGESDALSSNDGLAWLLPEIVGDIKVAASSGVVQFQVGVPVDCAFDEIETCVSGVVVEPLELKPGLQTVYLHFYDLFRNSIVLGELRLTGASGTQAIPFHLTVGEWENETFEHSQAFSESEKQAWGIEADTAGESVWTSLSQSFLAKLPDFERRIQQRPCKRSDLETVGEEFNRGFTLLRRRREEMRSRNAFLPDPPNMGGAVHRVRAALRMAYGEHKKAAAVVRQIQELVERGHIRRAAEAAKRRGVIVEFSDLNLDFVAEAEVQYRRQVRRLIIMGFTLAAGMVLVAIIIKLRTTPSPP